MKSLYFFYVFLTFSTGMVLLGIATTVYLKTQDTFVQAYLYFHSAFTLLVVTKVLLLYVKISTLYRQPYLFEALRYVAEFIAPSLLMMTIPILVHCLFSVPHAKRNNVIWGIIIMITYSIHHYSESAAGNTEIERSVHYIVGIVFLVVVLYSFFLGLYYSPKLQDTIKKKSAIKLLVLTGISLPAIAYDLLYRDSPIAFFPLIYCGFSIIFIHHFIKHNFNQPQVSQIQINTIPDDGFFEQYNISSREKEIVPLILQGYTNQKIGDTLFISANTVKTHIRNIYAKFGVKNRYELISFVKDACLSPPPTESF